MNKPTQLRWELHQALARRHFFRQMGSGLGAIALQSLLARESIAASTWQPPSGQAMFSPKAKRVIWLFMRGGVSHMESFDPKPALNSYAGKSIDETSFKSVLAPDKLKNVRQVAAGVDDKRMQKKILPLQVGWKHHGQSGIEISDWFPHIASCADDIAVIRSMWTTDNNHGAQVQFASGRHMLEPRVPTLGAWVTYGLSSMSDNLPAFINMGPRFFEIRDGHYLGPAYDAVNLKVDPKNPVQFLAPEFPVQTDEQSAQFDLVHQLDRLAAEEYPGDKALLARMQSYQLAFKMQSAIPETLNVDQESQTIKTLYGLDKPHTEPFARQLIAARRLAERGVRFIQIQHGDGAAGAWDAHSGLKANHSQLSAQVDQPVAGLLQDLKQRGMLEDTVVVFATEFGRTPGSEGNDGRDHHTYGFSIWMAGGGIQGGVVHGSTDEIGFHASEHPHYVTDIHATILHQLGLDPRKLEVPGRKRLERDFGTAIQAIL